MPIAAVCVVAHDHLRSHLADDAHEATRGFVEVCGPEAARLVVLGRAHHPRVHIAQAPRLDGPQLFQRTSQLLVAQLAQACVVLRSVQLGDHDLAVLAASAGDTDDAVARATVAGHDAPGRDGLVIGMGMDEEQRMTNGHAGQRTGQAVEVPAADPRPDATDRGSGYRVRR